MHMLLIAVSPHGTAAGASYKLKPLGVPASNARQDLACACLVKKELTMFGVQLEFDFEATNADQFIIGGLGIPVNYSRDEFITKSWAEIVNELNRSYTNQEMLEHAWKFAGMAQFGESWQGYYRKTNGVV